MARLEASARRLVTGLVALSCLATAGFATAAAAKPAAFGLGAAGQTTVARRTPSVPLAALERRLSAASPAPAVSPGASATLPRPVTPPVADLAGLIRPDLMITGTVPLSPAVQETVRRQRGVRSSVTVAVGPVQLAGVTARAIGVDPGAFRAWTPSPSARSNGLWHNVAAGELTTSFDLGKNTRLPLGGQVPVRGPAGPAPVPLRLGALASLGLPGIDVTVSAATGQRLGLAPHAGMLLSAPGVDLLTLRSALRIKLGPAVQVTLLHDAFQLGSGGPGLSADRMAVMLRTALDAVGDPYVWGATGPRAFDCSGLVQYAFAAAGVAVPRTAQQQWLAGIHIRPQDARPGDLLFWANDPQAPDTIDHVAIYLGGGRMVSAPHTGDVVHVAPVYSQNFRGVVRLVPGRASRVS